MYGLITIIGIAAAQAAGPSAQAPATDLIRHVIMGGSVIIASLAAAVAALYRSIERRQEKALERQAKGHADLAKELRGTITHERDARAKVEQQLDENMDLITELTAAIERLADSTKRSNGA